MSRLITPFVTGLSLGAQLLADEPAREYSTSLTDRSVRIFRDSTRQRIAARGVVGFPGWYVEPMTRQWLNAQCPWVLEPKCLPAFLKHEPPVLSEREVAMFANHLSRYVRAYNRNG